MKTQNDAGQPPAWTERVFWSGILLQVVAVAGFVAAWLLLSWSIRGAAWSAFAVAACGLVTFLTAAIKAGTGNAIEIFCAFVLVGSGLSGLFVTAVTASWVAGLVTLGVQLVVAIVVMGVLPEN